MSEGDGGGHQLAHYVIILALAALVVVLSVAILRLKWQNYREKVSVSVS